MRRTWLIAGGAVVVHLGTAWIYGYHRDEVYYLASGRRLAWGYVDHPPLTPLLYRLSDTLFGSSPIGLRVVPALLSGVIVLLTARMARELGASRRGQVLAALAAAIAPAFLTLGHFLSTVTAEVALWATATLVLIRLLKGADPRWWLAVGVVLGIAMLDKWTTVYFVAGVGAGLLVTPQRRVLATPWVLAGGAVAFGLWLPNLLWQAQHGWPQFALADAIRDYGMAAAALPFQLLFLSAAALVGVPGLFWLLRDPAGRHYRSLGIAFLVIIGLVMVTGGKPYYAAVFTPVLLAAGGASGFGQQGRWVPITMLVVGVLAAPFAIPILPLSAADATRPLNKEIGEMTGWPHVVDVVAEVYRDHPRAAIFTSNYSEAGVIELLGPDRGLPRPISGHNTYWYWGHPRGNSAETLIVGFPESYLHRWWGDVRRVATIRTPGGVHNMEDGTPVWIGRDQRVGWDAMWADLKHFE